MPKAAEDLTIQEQIEYHERHIAVLQQHLNTSAAGPHEKQYVADLERRIGEARRSIAILRDRLDNAAS